MKSSIFLLAILLGALLFNGCLGKEKAPATTEPPATTAEIPESATVSDAELPNEPTFEVNETVDLGSIV